MSRILLIKAETDIGMARLALTQSDDYYVLNAAYHVQQAVEKTLKFALEELGVDYQKTHRISALVKQMPDTQDLLSDEDLEFLEAREDSFANWESNVRYDNDYMASRRLVSKVLDFAEQLLCKTKSWSDARLTTEVKPEGISVAELGKLSFD